MIIHFNRFVRKRSEKSVLPLKDVQTLASESGIFDHSETSQSLQFLHDLGSLQVHGSYIFSICFFVLLFQRILRLKHIFLTPL